MRRRIDVAGASCIVGGGGRRQLPSGGMLELPGAAGSPPGAALLVAGERQAVAVGERGEEEASLVKANCRRGALIGEPCRDVSSCCQCGFFNFHLSIFSFFYCHILIELIF